jgi:hypothetical protein
MRRFLLAIAAVGLATVPMARVASAQTRTDSVSGSGTARFISGGLSVLTTPFDIDVQAGPNGENPTGTVTLLLTFTDPGCLVCETAAAQRPPPPPSTSATR